TLVSRAAGIAGAVGNGGSTDPSISTDGLHVAFQSFATNFSADDGDLINDIFVRDTQANTTTLVSRSTGAAGPAGDNNSDLPSISPTAATSASSPSLRISPPPTTPCSRSSCATP